MPSTEFTVHTALSPQEVMTLVTDFGPERASRWPNIDEKTFTLHEQGPNWAEVTEGNSMGWERERYSWDADAGTVSIETLDSNLWATGSGWQYRLTRADGGTDVHVRLTRVGKGVRGKLVGAVIPLAGSRVLAKQFGAVLRRAEAG
jgi:hypothetical protein